MAGEHAHFASMGNPSSAAGIYRPVSAPERCFQGELVDRIVEWIPKYDTTSPNAIDLEPRSHGLAVVVTQDCDLEQDWAIREEGNSADTELLCVLLCPACPADELRDRHKLTTNLWTPIRNNKNERYQYLAEIPKDSDQTGEGHVALLVDFKSLFAIRTDELYRQLCGTGRDAPRRRCRLNTPWREHLQCRFAAYQARIGLPRDHFLSESRRSTPPGPVDPV